MREYTEGYEVCLVEQVPGGRLVVKATNEGRYDSTAVDLVDLLNWLAGNRPELLPERGG